MQLPIEHYPFASNYADVRGQQYHYLDEGSGDPVVMVHGNPTWSFYYRELVKELRRDHRCLVPDHIGCGLSARPSEAEYEYTLEERVNDLEAWIDGLELGDDITLVLHDWGGMIGMSWATRHPERVKRIVVMNTAAFRLPETRKLPWQLKLVRETPLGAFLVNRFNAFSAGAVHLAAVRPMSRSVADGYRAPYVERSQRLATLRFVQDIPLKHGDRAWDTVVRTEEHLPRFADRPFLVLWGEKDFVFDDHFLQVWKQKLPDVEYQTYPYAGHYLLEDATGAVISRIRRFLQEHPLDTAEA